MFPHTLTPGYRRSICEREGRVLICSTCRVCGLEIVDSVTDTLVEREEEHRKQCSMGTASALD
ncbi:MAG TPA: hypothetical protein VMU28_06495 [Terriglobales bacterium]|nr:hypothetical protein [Terriglobales bacterium]